VESRCGGSDAYVAAGDGSGVDVIHASVSG